MRGVVFCGCQWPMGEGGPAGGPGRARLRQAPTALGSGVVAGGGWAVIVRGCMTGWGCVRWVGCMRDFDTNGVGVLRRGALPQPPVRAFLSIKKQALIQDLFSPLSSDHQPVTSDGMNGAAVYSTIVPPPRTTSPSYNTAAWPGVMALWGSSNWTVKVSWPVGVTVAGWAS